MMPPFEKDLPFKSDEAYNGWAEVNGILHVERKQLVLEFQVKDALLGALKSSTKELKISYLELSKAIYTRGWFSSQLDLKVKSMKLISRFPGASDGMITLKIKRKYKEVAEDIESYVNLRIAEMGLEKLEGEV